MTNINPETYKVPKLRFADDKEQLLHTESLGVAEILELGKCRGVEPDLFFPTSGAGVIKAKKICADCVVQEQCLDYALDNKEEFGVWGGKSERQRRRILKSRRKDSKD